MYVYKSKNNDSVVKYACIKIIELFETIESVYLLHERKYSDNLFQDIEQNVCYESKPNLSKGRHQHSPLRATQCFREMLVSCFCGTAQKAITTIFEWCLITIKSHINNPDPSVRLLQKSQTM